MNFTEGCNIHQGRSTVSFEDIMATAKALNVGYKQAFVLSDGDKIEIKFSAMKDGGGDL